jgi:hypothetical protein
VALNQLLLSQRIAGQDERASVLVWGAAAVFAVGAFAVPGLTWVGLVALACGVNLVLATTLALRAARHPAVRTPAAAGQRPGGSPRDP